MRDLKELGIKVSSGSVNLQPASDKDIQDFESELEVKLPADYISFLRFSNGGVPALDTFQEWSDDDSDDAEVDEWTVNAFLPLERTSAEPIIWNTTRKIFATGDKSVPIAYTPGGDLIVLHYEAESPTVKVRDHEMGRIVLVANSFGEFIDSLFYAEDDDDDDD